MRTFARAGVVGLAGAALLAGCGGAKVADVVVSPAQARTVTVHPGGSGTFAATVDVPVVLGYRGLVTHVDVSLGQKVSAGQVLMGVSSDQLAQAVSTLQVRLQADQATLAIARAVLRQPLTASRGLTSAQSDKVAAAAARVGVDQRLLDLAQGKSDLLKSPISGVVGDLKVQTGYAITPTTVLVEIIDSSRVSVTAQLPVSYAGQIRVGDAVVLRGVGTDVRLEGHIDGVAPQTVTGGQSFAVVASADNDHGQALPGMAAYAQLMTTAKAAVVVNQLAVHNNDGMPTVFVIRRGKVELRPVRLGLSDGVVTQVLSGVGVDDSVVIAGAQSLTDGDPVNVTKTEQLR